MHKTRERNNMNGKIFESDGEGLLWRGDGQTLSVQPWGRDAVRVRSRLQGDVIDTDHALLPPASTTARHEIDGHVAWLTVGKLRVILTESAEWDNKLAHEVFRCHVAFEHVDGRPLLRERGKAGSLDLKARDLRPRLGGEVTLTMAFEPTAQEHLWGMGQYQNGIGDLKGASVELAHRNSQASVPFVISSAGYGFLWHNPAIGRATFATNVTEWYAEACTQLDYWITAGDTPAEITRAYADATGHVPMMPEYGLGFWQCKLRYWNQEQLLGVAREHTRRGLPLDVIVADFFHWPNMGDYRFDEEFWPDPAAMVAELRAMGAELMVSVWPQVSHESENFAAFRKGDMLIRAERGPDVHMSYQGPSAFVDVTNPRARKLLWEICKRNYHDFGVRLFWLDEAEPEYACYDFDNYRYFIGPNLQVGNLYPQHFSRAFFEGQRAAGQEDVINLVRCAWVGSQRYGALVWSGDIESTFEDLRHQIVAGIHMGAAGIPWWTTDIGGFHHGLVTDPAFHELLVRWFQFGTFCPVMRLHGDRRPSEPVTAADGTRRQASGGPNELWSYGDELYEIFARFVRLRETLRDYSRAAMLSAHRDGQPVIRGLFHEFPDDETCWSVTDSYLYGPDILVAPITQAGARSRNAYLPGRAQWTDLRTGQVFQGGQTVVVEAPLEQIPVFARDGALAQLAGRL
jgi:alpha-D-xyloside xylohydrolase